MQKRNLLMLALLGLTQRNLSASTITVGDFSGSGVTFVENPVTKSNGSPLTNGAALVRIGFLTDSSSAVLTSLASPLRSVVDTALSTYFVGLGDIGGDADLGALASGGPRVIQRTVNGISSAGRIAGNVSGVNVGVYTPPTTITGVPSGTRLVMLVYDTLTPSTATEMGIFSSDDVTWRMPADSLSNITLLTTLVDTNAEVYRGTRGSLHLSPIGVPEPSVSLLALGAIGLGLRRRR
jgi:hypothetical protein